MSSVTASPVKPVDQFPHDPRDSYHRYTRPIGHDPLLPPVSPAAMAQASMAASTLYGQPISRAEIKQVPPDKVEWKQLIDGYKVAYGKLSTDEQLYHALSVMDLKDKGDAPQLSRAIKAFDNSKAVQGLRSFADQLIRDTFTVNDGQVVVDTPKALLLSQFWQEVDAAGIYDRRLTVLRSMTDPNLDASDVVLLAKYFKASHDKEKQSLRGQLGERLRALTVAYLDRFDGVVDVSLSTEGRRFYAFVQAVSNLLDADSGLDADAFIGQALQTATFKYVQDAEFQKLWLGYQTLSALTAGGANATQAAQLELLKGQLQQQVAKCEMRYDSLTWDQKDKRKAVFQELWAMRFGLLAAGIEVYDVTLSAYEVLRGLTKLDGAVLEYEKMFDDVYDVFYAIAQSPEGADNQLVKTYYLNYLNALADRAAQLSVPEKLKLAFVLHVYLSFAPDFGLSSAEIESLTDKLRPPKREQRLTVDELYQRPFGNNLLEVRVEDIPPELEVLLKAGGGWEQVQDIKSVVFTRGTITYGLGGLPVPGAVGLYMDSGMCVIRTHEFISENPLPVVAHVMVHEVGGHHEWYQNFYTEPEKQRSTPGERNAYALEFQFIQKLVATLPMTDNELRALSQSAWNSAYMVRQANRLMGYAQDDFATHREHMNDQQKSQEMGFYPSQITSDAGYMELQDMRQVFFNNDRAFEPALLDGIFLNDYYLGLSLKPERDEDQQMVRDDDGNVVLLDYRRELIKVSARPHTPLTDAVLGNGLAPLWFYFESQGISTPSAAAQQLLLFDLADSDDSPYTNQDELVLNQFSESDLRIIVANADFGTKIQAEMEAIYQEFVRVQAGLKVGH